MMQLLGHVIATADFPDYGLDDDGCFNCGGEGWIWSCFDNLCASAEVGCSGCERPCEICNPRGEL